MNIMNSVVMTNAQLIKAKKRLSASKLNEKFPLDSSFNGCIVKGLYRTFKEIIIEDKDGKTFLFSVENKNQKEAPSISPKKDIKINLVKIDNLKYDDKIFKSLKTEKPIDYMFSSEGGIFPATNYMIIGDPGIGKSTQTLDILAQIKKVNPESKVLFISGEMNQIDMFGYVKRYPTFGQIPTLFLCDYIDDNPKEVIEKTFQLGWDLILIDSFIEVQESIQASCGITRTYAEKWLIDLMIQHNKGKNKGRHYTSFLAIQQVTKGGNFVGSNKLKHNTTGMIELRYSSEFSGDRYAKVTKNRRGFKYERIFFSLNEGDTVVYDQKRIDRDEEIQKRISREKELLLSEEEKFNMIFNLNTTESEFVDNQ